MNNLYDVSDDVEIGTGKEITIVVAGLYYMTGENGDCKIQSENFEVVDLNDEDEVIDYLLENGFNVYKLHLLH